MRRNGINAISRKDPQQGWGSDQDSSTHRKRMTKVTRSCDVTRQSAGSDEWTYCSFSSIFNSSWCGNERVPCIDTIYDKLPYFDEMRAQDFLLVRADATTLHPQREKD